MLSKQGQQGFTLVEALLAMTILGIAVTSILTTFSSSLVAGKVSEDRALVTLLMDDLRSYVRSGMFSPMQINQGTFSQYPEYSWQVTYTMSETQNLYQVEMMIQWMRGSRQNTVRMVTYHYDNSATVEEESEESEGSGR